MKFIVTLLMLSIFTFFQAQDYTESNKILAQCKKDINDLNKSQQKRNSEYEKKKAELKSGLFCSKCNKSKTEIEKGGSQTFEQHLKSVNGYPIATQQMFDDAHKSYMGEYNSYSNSYDRKKESCEQRINDANANAFGKWQQQQLDRDALTKKKLKEFYNNEKTKENEFKIKQEVDKEIPKTNFVSTEPKLTTPKILEKTEGTASGSTSNYQPLLANVDTSQLDESMNTLQESQNEKAQEHLDEIQNINTNIESNWEKTEDIKNTISEVKSSISESIPNSNNFNMDEYLNNQETVDNKNSIIDDAKKEFSNISINIDVFKDKINEIKVNYNSFFNNENKLNQNFTDRLKVNEEESSNGFFSKLKQDAIDLKQALKSIPIQYPFDNRTWVVDTYDEKTNYDDNLDLINGLNEARCKNILFRMLPGCRPRLDDLDVNIK